MYDQFERKWRYYARVAEGLVRPLRIRRDSRVLELASGTGACSSVIASRCPAGEVVCIERSEAMIRFARANLKSAGLENVSFEEGDVTRLSELVKGMARFDFAVCNSAFWQFPEPRAVINALKRSLNPRGLFAFNIPFWYRSEKERQAYRKKIDEILSNHDVDPSKFWNRRQPTDYRALLRSSRMKIVRDASYAVVMRAQEREEWRRIPVFARRWGNSKDIPESVAAEIRREVRRMNLMPWPANSASRRRWHLLIARAQPKGR